MATQGTVNNKAVLIRRTNDTATSDTVSLDFQHTLVQGQYMDTLNTNPDNNVTGQPSSASLDSTVDRRRDPETNPLGQNSLGNGTIYGGQNLYKNIKTINATPGSSSVDYLYDLFGRVIEVNSGQLRILRNANNNESFPVTSHQFVKTTDNAANADDQAPGLQGPNQTIQYFAKITPAFTVKDLTVS